ncbi:hypothetical protein [Blastochloris tepida]|nr:hypothetical protein [Blastochloris tepida]
MTPEPIFAVALVSCAISLAAGFALGRLTLPDSRGAYARPWR